LIRLCLVNMKFCRMLLLRKYGMVERVPYSCSA
jgi:hypothetical protein